jgi:hypothetical protein
VHRHRRGHRPRTERPCGGAGLVPRRRPAGPGGGPERG